MDEGVKECGWFLDGENNQHDSTYMEEDGCCHLMSENEEGYL